MIEDEQDRDYCTYFIERKLRQEGKENRNSLIVTTGQRVLSYQSNYGWVILTQNIMNQKSFISLNFSDF